MKITYILMRPFVELGKILKDSSTNEFGKDYDTVNLEATLAFLVGIGLVIAGFMTGKDFNLDTYALGVGALLAATAGAQRYKPKAVCPPAPVQETEITVENTQ